MLVRLLETQKRVKRVFQEMTKHVPVLLNESIEGLNIKKDGVYVDMTLGRGGHSKEILKRLQGGHLYCFDQDHDAIVESEETLKAISSSYTLIEDNFVNVKARLKELGVDKVDGFLFDLGVSSVQFDEGERGFSYRYDARLDMRMNKNNPLSAYEVVNNYSLEELTKIFKEYGEEKFAYKIASEIVKNRVKKPIETTFELVEVVKNALPMKVKNKKGHPAKQIFQAIRIEVNNELEVLSKALTDALEMLNEKGRLAVITFHSLEDRIVKKLFISKSTDPNSSRFLPPSLEIVKYRLVNRKAIIPREAEIIENHRASSSKLRVIERIIL